MTNPTVNQTRMTMPKEVRDILNSYTKQARKAALMVSMLDELGGLKDAPQHLKAKAAEVTRVADRDLAAVAAFMAMFPEQPTEQPTSGDNGGRDGA